MDKVMGIFRFMVRVLFMVLVLDRFMAMVRVM